MTAGPPPRAPDALVEQLTGIILAAFGTPEAAAEYAAAAPELGVLPQLVKPGDTIAWRARSRTRSYGLVEYTTGSHAHVVVAGGYGKATSYRYPIAWERVLGHWPGRGEYDRRVLGAAPS